MSVYDDIDMENINAAAHMLNQSRDYARRAILMLETVSTIKGEDAKLQRAAINSLNSIGDAHRLFIKTLHRKEAAEAKATAPEDNPRVYIRGTVLLKTKEE